MNDSVEWRLIEMEERPPHFQQAIEEVLLKRVSSGQRKPTIRFWEDSREHIMLGRFQSVRNEVREEKARKDGVEIARRITGGGAMYTEPRSQITYSLYLPEHMLESNSIQESYLELDNFAVKGLKRLGYDVYYQPVNDICSGKGKIGGAAQTRYDGAVLHHTRITYKMNVEKMVRYLRIGEEKIVDKAIESAEKRVNPLYDQDSEIGRLEVISGLIDSFSEGKVVKGERITREEKEAAEKLVEEKFGTRSWIYRFS